MDDKVEDFSVTSIWPGAYKRGERFSAANNPMADWFVSGGERYAMDEALCGSRSDWYQYDTDQDAHYFGIWCNPVLRIVVHYTEGDIGVVRCETPDDYRREIESLHAWMSERNDMPVVDFRTHSGRWGLDDHDERHDAKIGPTVTETRCAGHTPDKLRVETYEDGSMCLVPVQGFAVATLALVPPERIRANADRLAACWNACEGIDPEAVPLLLEACKHVREALSVRADYWQNDVEEYGYLLDALDAVDNAIAKAEPMLLRPDSPPTVPTE